MATAFSLTGSIRFVPKLIDTLTATEITDTATASIALGLTDGTGDGAANAYWRDVVTVATGATAAIDLRALPLIAFGGTGTLTLSAVKALLVVNRSQSRGVTFNASGSNLWTPFVGGAVSLGSDAVWLSTNPGAGWAVTTAARVYQIANDAQPVSVSGNTVSGSATLTGLSSTSSLRVGLAVAGAGIPASATITSIPSATTVTLSSNATATANGVSLTFQNPPASIEIYIVGVKA